MDYICLVDIFFNLAPKNIDERMIGSVTKRYLEAVHNIKIGVGNKIAVINKKNRNQININQNKEGKEGLNSKRYTFGEALKIVNDVKTKKLDQVVKKYGKDIVIDAIKNL